MIAIRIVAITVGIILAIVAALAFAMDILAFIDPVGAKGSDDNDPFGKPPSRQSIALQAVVTVTIGIGGIWLALHHARRIRHGA